MTTLAAALTDSATEMRVNAADADPAPYYQIDSEVVRLLANSTTIQDGFSPSRTLDMTLWQIERGDAATTPASHLSGATVSPLWPQVAGEGGGATVVTSDTDPGAIGAGNVWLREYDDTAVTGDMLYDIHVRNAADDGWLRPQLLQIAGGVLRSRVTLDGPATGGDVEVRDASGNQLLLMAWGPTGELDITNQAADFSWVNKLQLAALSVNLERTDADGTHQVFMDETATQLARTFGESIILSATGVEVTTAGTFTYNGVEVATVP